MTQWKRAAAVAGLLLSAYLGTVKECGAQLSPLTAFYTAPVASMAPMWIAKEAGFFKKNGLDVKLVFIASGPWAPLLCSEAKPTSGSSEDLPH